MGRTQLSHRRLSETRKANIGRIIIFCEGKTEKYYFDYFAEIMKKNKYTDVEVFLETANGNAQTVLNYTKRFMTNEGNNRKFGVYGKYLAFDCDDPQNIQPVVQCSKDYELLISNYLFETWLLMHFEDVAMKLSKKEIFSRLRNHLNSDYLKGHKGKMRQIIKNGDVEKAIDNAKRIEQQYQAEGKSIYLNLKEMNPYTSVYRLIEQFMVEISTK